MSEREEELGMRNLELGMTGAVKWLRVLGDTSRA